MSKVEVVCSALVGISNTNNANPLSRLNLTPWDLRQLRAKPIQRGILFLHPKSHQIHIHHLKISLSRTLDFFPPLAGRLATVRHDDSTVSFFVDCNNAGAEFVHAVAGTVSVSDILEPYCVPEHLVSSLFQLNGVGNLDAPLLGVQVTELADGVFIGCAASHAVVDGYSFWHFFKSWSEISRGLNTISKPPVFERWFPGNVKGFIRVLLQDKSLSQKLVNVDPPPLMRRVFRFSKESLAKLKARANSEAGTDSISSLQALSAHLWRSYTRCRPEGEVKIKMTIGARGRIPLAEGYFGNAVYGAETAMDEEELLGRGLGHAAAKINELVGAQTEERAVEFVEYWVKKPSYVVKPGSHFVIMSSPRHDVYGVDFGWGKPVGVRCGNVAVYDGNMCTFPSAVAGGIEVHACSLPEVLQAMEQDEDADFMEAFTL